MLREVTSGDVKAQVYPIRGLLARSSEENEDDISEELDRLFSSLMGLKLDFLYQNLPLVPQVDTSSLKFPRFKPENETYLTEELSEEEIIGKMIEYDPIVRMSPLKEYTVRVRIESINKATPRVVEPEGI
jgi:hypothetical protein